MAKCGDLQLLGCSRRLRRRSLGSERFRDLLQLALRKRERHGDVGIHRAVTVSLLTAAALAAAVSGCGNTQSPASQPGPAGAVSPATPVTATSAKAVTRGPVKAPHKTVSPAKRTAPAGTPSDHQRS